jgi:hypothetical protein
MSAVLAARVPEPRGHRRQRSHEHVTLRPVDLWRCNGTYVGFRDGDGLWSGSGKYLGRCVGTNVFNPAGLYLGELVVPDRLAHDPHKRGHRTGTSSRGPRGRRFRGRKVRRTMPIGLEDFP